jgi:membrane protease subunit HflC
LPSAHNDYLKWRKNSVFGFNTIISFCKEFRSKGAEEAEIIRAAADKERTIILANAYRDSEKIRGEGDAVSANNYAKAYSKDAEFYSFYRALESYKKSFTGQNDIMVLNPNTEFFRHFK